LQKFLRNSIWIIDGPTASTIHALAYYCLEAGFCNYLTQRACTHTVDTLYQSEISLGRQCLRSRILSRSDMSHAKVNAHSDFPQTSATVWRRTSDKFRKIYLAVTHVSRENSWADFMRNRVDAPHRCSSILHPLVKRKYNVHALTVLTYARLILHRGGISQALAKNCNFSYTCERNSRRKIINFNRYRFFSTTSLSI